MPWELSFLDFIQENLRCGFLDVFMPALTRLGDGGVFWIVLSLALLLFPKTRRTGAIVTMALLLEFLCCNLLLKPLVARIRPYDVNPSVVLLVQRLVDFSFPSGHTGVAFAVTSGLYYSKSPLWSPAAVLSIVMAFSRLYLYVHYPTDVLAGVLLGIMTGWAGSRIVSSLGKKKHPKGIVLAAPGPEHEAQVMAFKAAMLRNGDCFDGCAGLEDVRDYRDWLDFEGRLSRKYGADYTPSTVRLAVREEDGKVVGIIDFRHRLIPFLLRFGGNIGYSVLPQERGKGYAKEMLRLMLEECRAQGLEKVLVTCDKENIPSARTIEGNGGVLENEVADEAGLSKSGIIRRYWITLN